jgi:hypothetical protein
VNDEGRRTTADPGISARPDLTVNVAAMPVATQVTGLEQEVGIALLELTENSWQLIPQRSEMVEILDHERARRTVRVQVDLHAFAGEESEQWPPWGPGDPFGVPRRLLRRPLVRWRGRILLPLAVLDAGSDELPYVTNEAGEVVATLPDHELRRFLRAGLIAAARTAGPPLTASCLTASCSKISGVQTRQLLATSGTIPKATR